MKLLIGNMKVHKFLLVSISLMVFSLNPVLAAKETLPSNVSISQQQAELSNELKSRIEAFSEDAGRSPDETEIQEILEDMNLKAVEAENLDEDLKVALEEAVLKHERTGKSVLNKAAWVGAAILAVPVVTAVVGLSSVVLMAFLVSEAGLFFLMGSSLLAGLAAGGATLYYKVVKDDDDKKVKEDKKASTEEDLQERFIIHM